MFDNFGIVKSPKDTKIVVAMSGGVDSSTVAAMIHDQGYNVIGLTMQLYDHGVAIQKKGACCAGQDIYDAKIVADKLKIPHYVLNYESKFKQDVIDDFADTYLKGETPIPCIKCNQTVKFRDLIQMAKDLEADALVTGHYVRRINNGGVVELHKAIDKTKDQSYFLFSTTKSQLEYLRFPLGNFTKEQTRNMALKFGLDVASKPDSQDICFVPEGKYAELVQKLRPESLHPGEIRHINGDLLGMHNGIINYTIGQRKGLGISSSDALYVIKIDHITKTVYVGPDEALNKSRFILRDMNWLCDPGQTEFKAEVRMRSSQVPVEAKITSIQNNQAEVVLYAFSRAITPGQACVIYDKDRVLGGGWITREIQ